MKAIGTEIGFQFTLHRASLAEPVQTRTGRGIVVGNDDHTVWPSPGYAVRVTESPDYAPGTIVKLSTGSVRS